MFHSNAPVIGARLQRFTDSAAAAEDDEVVLLGRFGTSLKMGIVGLPNVG